MNLDKFHNISNALKSHQKLIAVSKGQDIDKIKHLYDIGHRDFGENFLQELKEKKDIIQEKKEIIQEKDHIIYLSQSDHTRFIFTDRVYHYILRSVQDDLMAKDYDKAAWFAANSPKQARTHRRCAAALRIPELGIRRMSRMRMRTSIQYM